MAAPPWLRWLLGGFTALVCLFLLTPVAVVVVLAFDHAESGGFPIERLSLRWFEALGSDPALLGAFTTSFVLGLSTAAISGTLGAMAAYGIARTSGTAARIAQSLLTLPILVPHLILGVGLLLAFRSAGLSKSFGLLLAGHVALTLPFVVLTTLPRFRAMPVLLEEAARTLGATRRTIFRSIVLPLSWPALASGAVLAFMSSLDEVTATLFWRPLNVETVPTQIMGMLQYSIDGRLNALGAVLVAISIAGPLAAALLSGRNKEQEAK